MYSDLYSLVAEREFVVDNPYIFHTKTDMVSAIANKGVPDLISHTGSCTHTRPTSRSQWHCGTCSQCIDRRIAIIAAGQAEFDPATDYISDVFAGPRKEGYEQNMAVHYVRHMKELAEMSEAQIEACFQTELARASRYYRDRSGTAAKFITMHRRQAETALSVLANQLQKYSEDLFMGRLPSTSMLVLAAGQRHLTPSWSLYADRIVELLRKGLPKACNSEKPKNEPRLQEICDAILTANDTDLIREYPLHRWSAVKTKSDWSEDKTALWVELKYVREKSDIHPISEAIAADITKYGASNVHVLFVIYDPFHIVLDEENFASAVDHRNGTLMCFIR